MAQDLISAIARIQTLAAAIVGITEAPANPPEGIAQFPFIVTYPESGYITEVTWSTTPGASSAMGFHTVVTEIHVARQILPKDVAKAIPFGELFWKKVGADPTLNGIVETIAPVDEEMPYRFGRLTWAGEEHIGYQIRTSFVINMVW